MIKDILNSIPVLLISIVATVTGGTAISKVAQELQPSLTSDNREVQEIRVASVTPTDVPGLTDTPTTTPTPTGIVPSGTTLPTLLTPTKATSKGSIASANTFTLATLAQHNVAGSCYVAYKSVVYDVSNHPSWQNCTHHGVSGGRDITSTFPHPTSYFNSLPKVGTLTSGSGSNSGSGSGTSGSKGDDSDDDSNEDENHQEDESDDEREVEDEHEIEIERD